MRIDAHQHFWRPARGDYGWLTPDLDGLYRDFLPGDLAPLLDDAGIGGTVLVQAAPSEDETRFMLSLADRHDFVRGVVGWTEFEAPDASARIAALAAHPRLKGLRPMIQDLPDDDWMLRPGLGAAFRALADAGLVFDALVFPRHLPNLARLLDRHPAMRAVVDHGAKPAIAAGEFHAWAASMAAIARDTDASCKLSGLVTEAGPQWTADRLAPYVDHLLATFGPTRLIWGSDWPVCTLAATYRQWLDATDRLLGHCTPAERAAILGDNATRTYRL
jgi:L-fuconolactonase